MVCCPVAVKLKPEELGVAKRLSHCCGKNLHDWRPQASRAESVSIQDGVIFSAISSFQPTWSTSLCTYRVGIYSTVSSEEKGKDWLPDVWVQGLTPEDKTTKKTNCQNQDCGQLQEWSGKESGRRGAKSNGRNEDISLGTRSHYRVNEGLEFAEQSSGLNGRAELTCSIYVAQYALFLLCLIRKLTPIAPTDGAVSCSFILLCHNSLDQRNIRFKQSQSIS